MEQLEQGDVVEPITYPGYTRATRKRKRQEVKDVLDKTMIVGTFAVVDLPNDDSNYKLRLGLVKITAVHDDYINFSWYHYSGYPDEQDPSYKGTWHLQVLRGKGQKVDTGWCYFHHVVFTFEKLTKSKKIPDRGRLAPLKLIDRALRGDFGPLPQDVECDIPDDIGSDSSYVEEDNCAVAPVATVRRTKRRVK